MSGLRGLLAFEGEEMGPVASGRPIRLSLTPTGEGERLGFNLLDNHRRPPEGARQPQFIVSSDISPGTYQARIFLDTDRDGHFTPCADDAFGDRASAEPFMIDVLEGELLDVGERRLEFFGCPVPEVAVVAEVELAEHVQWSGLDAGPLRLLIEEAGGWSEDRLLGRRFDGEAEPQAAQRIALAPGVFRLTAYIDADEDERLATCDEEAVLETLAAVVEVRLDAEQPEARPQLSLEPYCGR